MYSSQYQQFTYEPIYTTYPINGPNGVPIAVVPQYIENVVPYTTEQNLDTQTATHNIFLQPDVTIQVEPNQNIDTPDSNNISSSKSTKINKMSIFQGIMLAVPLLILIGCILYAIIETVMK